MRSRRSVPLSKQTSTRYGIKSSSSVIVCSHFSLTPATSLACAQGCPDLSSPVGRLVFDRVEIDRTVGNSLPVQTRDPRSPVSAPLLGPKRQRIRRAARFIEATNGRALRTCSVSDEIRNSQLSVDRN